MSHVTCYVMLHDTPWLAGKRSVTSQSRSYCKGDILFQGCDQLVEVIWVSGNKDVYCENCMEISGGAVFFLLLFQSFSLCLCLEIFERKKKGTVVST